MQPLNTAGLIAMTMTWMMPTFAALVENGYLDSELYDDGEDESVIETDITAEPGEDPPVITYDAGDEESCNWLLDRGDNRQMAQYRTPKVTKINAMKQSLPWPSSNQCRLSSTVSRWLLFSCRE